jgi:hypothetical protein
MKHNENPPNGKTYHWNGKQCQICVMKYKKKAHNGKGFYSPGSFCEEKLKV